MMPFFRNVPVGNAVFNACGRYKIPIIAEDTRILGVREERRGKKFRHTSMVGEVRRPQAKNSRKMTIVAWTTLGRP